MKALTSIRKISTYDTMGRRATKKVTTNGTLTEHRRFLYRGYLQIDSPPPRRRLTPSGQSRFAHCPTGLTAVGRLACCDLLRPSSPVLWSILWDPTQTTATRPLAIQKNRTWYTYGRDLTKNICETYRTDGRIDNTYAYTPYGEVTLAHADAQPLRWSSEYHDPELGLVYYNYRHYNPFSGRWTGRDIVTNKNAYMMVNNNCARTIDYIGAIEPFYGGYLQGGGIAQQYRDVENSRKKRIAELNQLIHSKSGPKVDCHSKDCKMITVVVEVGDPNQSFPDNYIGHTGISIGNDFYDLGPNYSVPKRIELSGVAGGVQPWWASVEWWKEWGLDTGRSEYQPADFAMLKQNLNCFAESPTVLISFCTCKEKAAQVEQYWKEIYQSMKNNTSPEYSFLGYNCSTSVWSSLGLESGTAKAPESLLEKDEMLAQLKNDCGSNSGLPAYMELSHPYFE